MRRDIEKILDDCLIHLLAEGKKLEDCLAQYSDHLSQLEPLLRLAKEIRALPRPEPRPPALITAQARVWEAAMLKQRGEGSKARLLSRWLAGRRFSLAYARLLAAVAVAVLIGFSSVVAAANSLPDSPLYPVKRTTERVQLFLTFNPSTKTQLHLSFAERRLDETLRLMDTHRPIDDATLIAMVEETGSAIEMICGLPTAEAYPLLNKAIELTIHQRSCLERMGGGLPCELSCTLDQTIAACPCCNQVTKGEMPSIQPINEPECECK